MRVVLASARSAPGVTTATLALASVWHERVLVVEASEDGGVVAARYGLTLEPGATTLAAATRNEPDAQAVWWHTQALPGTDERVSALVGPPGAEAAQMLWRTAADRLARVLAAAEDEALVLVDAGRLAPSTAVAPLISGADRLLLVARPRVEELQALVARLPVLGQLGPAPELLLVGRQPYGPDEVAATLGCQVTGVLAHDPAAADALSGIAAVRSLGRSQLLRTAATVVDRLTTAEPVAQVPPRPDIAPGAWTATHVTPAETSGSRS